MNSSLQPQSDTNKSCNAQLTIYNSKITQKRKEKKRKIQCLKRAAERERMMEATTMVVATGEVKAAPVLGAGAPVLGAGAGAKDSWAEAVENIAKTMATKNVFEMLTRAILEARNINYS